MARTLASVSLHPYTPSTVLDEGKPFYICRLLNCSWLDQRVTGCMGDGQEIEIGSPESPMGSNFRVF